MSTTKLERLQRRRKVADYHMGGLSYREIANKPDIDVSHQTVKRDVKWVEKKWEQDFLVDYNKAKARILAQIDRLIRELRDVQDRYKDGLTVEKVERKQIQAQKEEFTVDGDGNLKRDMVPSGNPQPLEVKHTKTRKMTTAEVTAIREIGRNVDRLIRVYNFDDAAPDQDDQVFDQMDDYFGKIQDADLSQFDDEPME